MSFTPADHLGHKPLSLDSGSVTLCFSCVDGKEIASARIHLVLLVPSDPITTDTSEGDYGEYQVQRDGNVMYVMAK